MESKYTIGYLYLMYGIIKIIVGVSVMAVPAKYLVNVPVLNKLVSVDKDDTLAGRMYEYIFTLFGVFTLLNGLSLLEYLPQYLIHFFEMQYTEYAVFLVLGTILIVFYSLVLYTSLPISKSKESYTHYKIFGLGGGISFLVMPLLWETLQVVLPAFHRLPAEQKSMVVITFTVVAAIVADIVYNYVRKNHIGASDVIPSPYLNGAKEIKKIGSNATANIVQHSQPLLNPN